MSPVAHFFLGLGLVIGGSVVMAPGVDCVGSLLKLSKPLLGLLTALAADSPEIASAVSAALAGARDVGLGVVLGSNLFNLAALLGVSALVTGGLHVRRGSGQFDGAVSVLITLLTACVIFGLLGPVVGLGLVLVVFALYVFSLWLPPEKAHWLPLPENLRSSLEAGLRALQPPGRRDERSGIPLGTLGGWRPVLAVVPALGAIIVGSMWMVHAALSLARAWSVSHGLVGTLIIAALTGLPNAYFAVRLARAGQGPAVVSETINSNTINLVVGIGLPAVIFGLQRTGGTVLLDLGWLLGLTLLAIFLMSGGCLRRRGGAILVALYLAFVAVRVLAG